MDNNVEEKVKELVADFKLEAALDVLIAQAKTQNQRKQNVLLVLKGKLALLEEQTLAGMLEPSDAARQKATIAHQILDIADGSPLDHEILTPSSSDGVTLSHPVTNRPNGNKSWTKYLLIAALLVGVVAAGIFFSNSLGENKPSDADELQPAQPKKEQATEPGEQPHSPSDRPLKVLDFPNLQKPFNFLDFGIEFRSADAEWISDSEIRLKLRCYLACKSNFGICYRAAVKVYADGKSIDPTEQSDTAAWVEQNATVTDDLSFVLPADAKEFHVELSRDKSTWKRPFKILR